MSQNPRFLAGGDINPCRFVKIDTTSTEAFQVIQATTNSKNIGIAQEGSRKAPGLAFTDGDLAAKDTETLKVWGLGEEALIELGSGGATQGDWLKSDTDGKGVATATSGTTVQFICAQALEPGSAGEKIRVQVQLFPYLPAVA